MRAYNYRQAKHLMNTAGAFMRVVPVVTSTFQRPSRTTLESDGRGPEPTTQPDASVTVQPSPMSVRPSIRNGPGTVSVARSSDTNTPVDASMLPQSPAFR